MNWRKPMLFAVMAAGAPAQRRACLQVDAWMRLPAGQRLALQERHLAALLREAAAHVPYYRDLLRAHPVVRADGGVNWAAFRALPLLDRADLSRLGDALLADDHQQRGSFINRTGGSSGSPTTFRQDRVYQQMNFANKLFYCEQYGGGIGAREIKLWGSERDIRAGRQDLKTRAQFWLFNREFVGAFILDQARRAEIVEILHRFRPVRIWGYVDSLYVMARHLEQEGIELPAPQVIFSAAGTLGDAMRAQIQRGFRCPVLNTYGGREIGSCANEERPGEGLVVLTHSHLVELVGDGPLKQIVITPLFNRSMPLIRYAVGDFSSGWVEGCEGWKLRDVSGRGMELLTTTAGAPVAPEYFIHMVGVFQNRGEIEKFQVVQRARDMVLLRLVLRPGSDRAALEPALAGIITQAMGGDCRVGFEYVDRIQPNASGKYFYTINEADPAPVDHPDTN